MARTAVLGLPRIGPDRELKVALEAHWARRTDAGELQDTARALRAAGAREAAIDVPRGGRLDWAPLRAKIARQGMRNSNVMAIAPTATIANIMGTSP